MKDTFDDDSRLALVKHRMDVACDTMKEALMLSNGGFYNGAIGRFYYACYYAAKALLLTDDIQVFEHHDVKTMLGLHFVSKGRLSVSSSQLYSILFYQWYSMDYDAFVYCDQEVFDELYPKAEAFIEEVKKLIESSSSIIEKEI